MHTNKSIISISLLDKLIDDDPDKQHENYNSNHQQLHQLVTSVKRDLENLLNTRSTFLNWPTEFKELTKSLFSYGIIDFSLQTFESSLVQLKFCQQVKETIQCFEPRFKQIEVQLLKDDSHTERILKMRITGLLYVEPTPESISFDSIIKPENKIFLQNI